MAEMVPDGLPRGVATQGERRLFEVLRKLPDDYIVYYEPIVGQRYPDFVLIAPDMGLLVIEVKGWKPHQILGGDDKTIRLNDRGVVKNAKHPLGQAREYKWNLVDECKKHPEYRELLQSGGEHENQFAFPFGNFVIMSNMTADNLKNHSTGDLTKIFRPENVAPRDALLSWEHMSGEEIRQKFKRFFDPFWKIAPLRAKQLNILRAVIHPEIRITPPITLVTEDSVAEAAELIAVLDLRQERNARSIGDGHRIIYGVAGSGKTVLLLSRAKILQDQNPDAEILFLCFNVSFCAYVRAVLADYKRVKVRHFDGWAKENGVPRRRRSAQADGPEDDESLGNRLKEVLEQGEQDSGRYEAVLIDEAQDFPPVWFECALAAMKEPYDGDLIIVADGSQNIRQKRGIVWSKIGIRARGRTINRRFDLDKNYRNSREIVELAAYFGAREDEDGEEGIPSMRVEPATAVRSCGFKPIVVECTGRQAECESTLDIIRKLLLTTSTRQDVPSGLRPSEIGVLYPRLSRRDKPVFMNFREMVSSLAPCVWLNESAEARWRVADPGIKIQTIHLAKGLQYRAVILMWGDQLPRPFEDTDEETDSRLLYVALTRAEEFLAITYSEFSPFIQTIQESGKVVSV